MSLYLLPEKSSLYTRTETVTTPFPFIQPEWALRILYFTKQSPSRGWALFLQSVRYLSSEWVGYNHTSAKIAQKAVRLFIKFFILILLIIFESFFWLWSHIDCFLQFSWLELKKERLERASVLLLYNQIDQTFSQYPSNCWFIILKSLKHVTLFNDVIAC